MGGWVEEEQAVGMRCWTCGMSGVEWVGGWVEFLLTYPCP